MKKIAIVGCGISGISSAYFLLKKFPNIHIDIYDSSKNLGGRIGSKKVNGKYLDFGGKNIGYNYKLFREFVSEQGNFDYEYFGVNTSKVINKQIVPINREKNLKSFLNLFKLANIVDLLKIFFYVKKVKKYQNEGFLGGKFFNKLSTKSDDKTIDQYFSKKCCKNIIRAMTVRMNGAEPDEYYIGNFGTNIYTAFDKYDQLKDGIYAVIEKFLNNKNISIVSSSKVEGLLMDNNKITGITYTDKDNNKESKNYYAVILALSATQSSKIVKNTLPKISKTLDLINYYPVLTMIVEYEKPVFDSEVRAVIFEEEIELSNAGAYSPKNLNLVRYTFSGRSARKLFSGETTKDLLLEIVKNNMPEKFDIKNNKILSAEFVYYKDGLCSYSAHHHEKLEKIDALLKKAENLYFTGDYYKGASIEACFQASKFTIAKI